MKEMPLTRERAVAAGEYGARSGGHFRTEKLFSVLNAARHVIDCETCKFRSRMIIGFSGPGVTDYFNPYAKIVAPDLPPPATSAPVEPTTPRSNLQNAIARVRDFFMRKAK